MVEITQNSLDISTDGREGSDWALDPFVGRRREFGALTSLIDGDGYLRKRSALVEGVAGVGKTRLVSEVLCHARRQGTRILQGACYHVPIIGPFFPFVQVLDQLSSSDDADSHLLRHWPEGMVSTDGWRSMTADVRARRAQVLRSLSETIVGAAGKMKTVLVVEDIHWGDVESLLLLNDLLDAAVHNLVLICTGRTDEPADPDVRQLIARIEQKSVRLALGGLDPIEARELLEALGGRGRITEEEFEQLYSFTEGNPLLLRELFAHLQETGLLDHHSVQEAIRRSKTPDRLTYVIDLRVRSLPSEVLRTVGLCAVVGPEFNLSLAAVASGEDERTIEGRLEIGIQRRILQTVDVLAEPRYRFIHPLFATRLYEELSATERRRAHRRVAEAGHAGSVRLTSEELATHHALGLDRHRRSIHYCQVAAERAEGLLAYETAARFWELALRCARARPPAIRAELCRRLGWSLWAASKWSSAAAFWAEAVDLFESTENQRRAAELALALGELYRWQQNLEQSTRWLSRALDLYPHCGPERARALALLGNIRSISDDSQAALPLLEEAERMLEDTRDPLVAYWISYGYFTSGVPAKGYAIAKDALAEAQRRGVDNSTALLAWTLFHCELSQLRLRAAQRYARLLREAAANSSDSVTVTNSFLCDVLLLAYAGKWREVMRLCERWMSRVRLLGPYQLATGRVIWAEAQHALGDAASACKELEKALPHLEQMRPLASLHMARSLLRLGRSEEARNIVQACLDDVMSSPRQNTGRVMLGEVVSYLDDFALWERLYTKLAEDRRRLAVVYSPISIQRVMGRLACRLRLWSKAIEHFDVAVLELVKGEARWELAQTYLDYAEMREFRGRRGDRVKAGALRLRAQALLGEMGIPGERPIGVQPFPWDNRFGLTGRELEVLRIVANGLRNPEIADTLKLSGRTFERHLESVFQKMGVNNRVKAIVLAFNEGLIDSR